jgi:hypothetical protein
VKAHAINYAARWRQQVCLLSTPAGVVASGLSNLTLQYASLLHAGILSRNSILGTVGTRHMKSPPLDPPVSDSAPSDAVLTGYDEQHLVTYLRLLDAEAEGADWREVARIVLHIDPEQEPDRAKRVWESHLARARWMTEAGYQHLLRVGPPH